MAGTEGKMDKLAAWLDDEYYLRIIGAIYDPSDAEEVYRVRLPSAFDVIIYFAQTRPSTLLTTR